MLIRKTKPDVVLYYAASPIAFGSFAQPCKSSSVFDQSKPEQKYAVENPREFGFSLSTA